MPHELNASGSSSGPATELAAEGGGSWTSRLQVGLRRNVGIGRRRHRGVESGLTQEELDLLTKEQRRFKLKMERELIEKTLAILVALAWSTAFHKVIETAPGKVGIAVTIYAVTWLLLWILASLLSHIHYGQLTLVMAELVAFLWRDASLGIFNEVWGPEETPEHGGSGNGTHPELYFPRQLQVAAASFLEEAHKAPFIMLALKYLLWAFGTAVVSALILTVVLNIRKRLQYFATERGEEIAEAVLDVEVDAIGLAVGYICFAAFCAGVFGPEWSESIESVKAEDRGSFGKELWPIIIITVLSTMLVAGVLTLETDRGGVREDGVRIHVQLGIFGYFLGFMYNRLCSLCVVSVGYGSITAGLTILDIAYPFVVFCFGIRQVWRAKQLERTSQADPADANENSENAVSRHSITNRAKLVALAWQTCMALAFEGLLDKVFVVYSSDGEAARFGIAIVLTAMWFVACGLMARLQHKTESDDDHLAETEAHDDEHFAEAETS